MKLLIFTLLAVISQCTSINKMNQDTGFVSLVCQPYTNAYQYILKNGYTVDINLTVELDCFDVNPSERMHTISALSQEEGFIIPRSGNVENQTCILTIYTENEPFTTDFTIYNMYIVKCRNIEISKTYNAIRKFRDLSK